MWWFCCFFCRYWLYFNRCGAYVGVYIFIFSAHLYLCCFSCAIVAAVVVFFFFSFCFVGILSTVATRFILLLSLLLFQFFFFFYYYFLVFCIFLGLKFQKYLTNAMGFIKNFICVFLCCWLQQLLLLFSIFLIVDWNCTFANNTHIHIHKTYIFKKIPRILQFAFSVKNIYNVHSNFFPCCWFSFYFGWLCSLFWCYCCCCFCYVAKCTSDAHVCYKVKVALIIFYEIYSAVISSMFIFKTYMKSTKRNAPWSTI